MPNISRVYVPTSTTFESYACEDTLSYVTSIIGSSSFDTV